MSNSKNNIDDTYLSLSAYIDGELNVAERRRVEELIKSDPGYAQEVEELRLLKRWLHDLPAPASRRSFTLDPATVPRARRLLFPTLRWATAIAAVLLMLTVSVDVLGNIGKGYGGGATAALSPSASGAAASSASSGAAAASGGVAVDEQGTRSVESGMASSANEAAPESEPLTQDALPNADAAAAGAASASASSAPYDSGVAGGAYPAPSDSFAATALASASAANVYPSASNGAGASIVAAPPLADTDTVSSETIIGTAKSERQPTPTHALRITQIVLLIATMVLGAGTWFTRQRNL